MTDTLCIKQCSTHTYVNPSCTVFPTQYTVVCVLQGATKTNVYTIFIISSACIGCNGFSCRRQLNYVPRLCVLYKVHYVTFCLTSSNTNDCALFELNSFEYDTFPYSKYILDCCLVEPYTEHHRIIFEFTRRSASIKRCNCQSNIECCTILFQINECCFSYGMCMERLHKRCVKR